MSKDVAAVVGPDGWAPRAALLARISRGTLDAWTAQGRLVRVVSGIYALPEAARHWRTRVAAALAARPDAVASHGTALALWGLTDAPRGPLHLTVGSSGSGRGSEGVVVHRSVCPLAVQRAGGLPVTPVARALAEAWGRADAGLPRAAVRAAVVTAVRRRDCSARQVLREVAARPRLSGRAELVALCRLLADGCRSELEIWGCLHVLRSPGMPPFTQQHPVLVEGRRFLLDAAYEEVLLAVEMDGAAWHGSKEQRERDIRRDALVATVGWQTLRFGFARLTTDPQGCRRDVRAVHEARRRLFGGR